MSDNLNPAERPPYLCYGRRPILSDVEEITPDNVQKVVMDALSVHNMNAADIRYLFDVYKGRQDILSRVKDVRPEINNKVVVNRANEIVSFKTSYLLGEPTQYISSASASDNISEKLTKLNEFMRLEGKDGKDIELANWFHICGVAYRLVLPDSQTRDPHGSPFNIYTLDPRNTFVINYSGVGNYPLAGVHIVRRIEKPDLLCVYTKNWYMEFDNASPSISPVLVKAEPVSYPEVPIVEYRHNQVRMGAFEPVLSQLHEINVVESNRIDAIEQHVQALLVFENCDVDEAGYDEMRQRGAIKIKSTSGVAAKVYAVENSLDQSGAQQTIDDLQASIYDICGMPSTQNGGASTSDTGAAVIFRDGWQQAEARAKETEGYFRQAEQRFLSNVLSICRNVRDVNIELDEVVPHFTRRNYADLLTKSQVLTTMLATNKIAPKLAFESCGLFIDSEAAYQLSQKYAEQMEAKARETANANPQATDNPDNPGENGARSGQPGENGNVTD